MCATKVFYNDWLKELKHYEVGPKQKALDTYWFEETIKHNIIPRNHQNHLGKVGLLKRNSKESDVPTHGD